MLQSNIDYMPICYFMEKRYDRIQCVPKLHYVLKIPWGGYDFLLWQVPTPFKSTGPTGGGFAFVSSLLSGIYFKTRNVHKFKLSCFLLHEIFANSLNSMKGL